MTPYEHKQYHDENNSGCFWLLLIIFIFIDAALHLHWIHNVIQFYYNIL